MPELPEVETTKNGVKDKVKNLKISKVNIYAPKLRYPLDKKISTYLKNDNFTDISRRGKYLIFKATKGSLIVHLGMSGILTLLEEKEDLKKS